MSATANNLTVIYYTANNIPKAFASEVYRRLEEATKGIPIIVINQPQEAPRSHLQIYKNAYMGASQVHTKYVAFCEDDVLYCREHFALRPPEGVFGYNKSVWSIYTWSDPPVFSWKDRRNMYGLICERDLFIRAMDERFAKYLDREHELGNDWFVKYWAEPGKYEKNLGVTIQRTIDFFSEPPLIAFSHETALSYLGLGKRKKMGHMRALEVPYWGKATDIAKLYG